MESRCARSCMFGCGRLACALWLPPAARAVRRCPGTADLIGRTPPGRDGCGAPIRPDPWFRCHGCLCPLSFFLRSGLRPPQPAHRGSYWPLRHMQTKQCSAFPLHCTCTSCVPRRAGQGELCVPRPLLEFQKQKETLFFPLAFTALLQRVAYNSASVSYRRNFVRKPALINTNRKTFSLHSCRCPAFDKILS